MEEGRLGSARGKDIGTDSGFPGRHCVPYTQREGKDESGGEKVPLLGRRKVIWEATPGIELQAEAKRPLGWFKKIPQKGGEKRKKYPKHKKIKGD